MKQGLRVDVSSYMLPFFFGGMSVALCPSGSTWHIILQPLTKVPGSHAISRPVMQTNITTSFTAEILLERQKIVHLCHNKRSSLDAFPVSFFKHNRILSYRFNCCSEKPVVYGFPIRKLYSFFFVFQGTRRNPQFSSILMCKPCHYWSYGAG